MSSSEEDTNGFSSAKEQELEAKMKKMDDYHVIWTWMSKRERDREIERKIKRQRDREREKEKERESKKPSRKQKLKEIKYTKERE